MRIAVNLATRPFIELRPLFARLRLAMGALLLLAIALAFGLHALDAKARQASAEMDALKARTAAAQAERARNEARMRLPENRGVLDRSQFLNTLFARKSFSWTAVMMDLERVLPAGVQVTSIEPVVAKEGTVSIRLRVTGERDRAIGLVRNLEHSERFIAPRLAGETALSGDKARAFGGSGTGGTFQNANAFPGQVPAGGQTAVPPPGGVEFEIFSDYNPLPPVLSPAAARAAKAEASSSVRDSTPVRRRPRKLQNTPATPPARSGPAVTPRREGAR